MATILNNDQPVANEAALNTAIQTADGETSAGTYVIEIGGPISLATALEAINLKAGVTLDIEGTNGSGVAQNQTIDGGGDERGLLIYSGVVSISDLTLTDMAAVGGAGGSGEIGGGGGAGLGGALYIAGATNAAGTEAVASSPSQALLPEVTLSGVNFSNDSATGGAGGQGGLAGGALGAGGGLGGSGGGTSGVGGNFVGGGGGIGAAGGDRGTSGQRGDVPDSAGGGAGIGYSVVSGSGAGLSGGGGGASSQYSYGGGGGGIGGAPGTTFTVNNTPVDGIGGDGGYGGGGGGGVYAGSGGFGGGSGGGDYLTNSDGDIVAGFGGGGGGGAAMLSGGRGGFGGGTGGFGYALTTGGYSNTYLTGGGGGLGAGGDIFVQQGASLTIIGGSLAQGTVTGGTGESGGADGSAYGGGIFLQGDESITFAPAVNTTQAISGVIADMTGSQDHSGETGAGALVMNGAGTLQLDADNTFTGGITIDSGTVELAARGAAGTGTIKFNGAATLLIDPAAATAGQSFEIAGFHNGDTIEINVPGGGADITNSGANPLLHLNGAPDVDFDIAQNGAGNFSLTIAADEAPVTNVPGAQPVHPGQTVAIGGVSVSDGDAVAYHETITVAISDTLGTLDATAFSGASVAGAGTSNLTLSGTLETVNEELATLSYTAPNSNAMVDTITLATSDGRGGSSTAQITADILQPVTSEAALNAAIDIADGLAANSGTYQIDIAGDVTLDDGPLHAINLQSGVTLDIEGTDGGGGAQMRTIDGGGDQRGLFVYSGVVNVENLTLADMSAQGGAGGAGYDGGGGGAGLGGGLFVAGATTAGGAGYFNSADPGQAVLPVVTLDNVEFRNDSAKGGTGGAYAPVNFAYGGGGGLSGGGGAGGSDAAGGGGGIGGTGGTGGGAGQPGVVPNGSAGGGGDSFNATSGGGGGGRSGGGGGGAAGTTDGVGGGGGIDGNSGRFAGAGGFGGGGGGGSYDGQGGFGGGGGGGPGSGGFAGFGGGGGAGQYGGGGESSFGGGTGGNGVTNNGNGGTHGAGGGGGLAAGGDIFVQQGGTLIIGSGTLDQGALTGGTGSDGGLEGSSYGDGLFIEGNQSITFAPAASETTIVSGVIADINGSDPTADTAGAGSLIMDGSGTLQLAADNTFTGGLEIEDGTVDLAATDAAGSGTISFENAAEIDPTLEFTPADAPANEIDDFRQNDIIQIDDFLATSAPGYANGTLTLEGTDDTGHISETVNLDIPGQTLSDFQINVGGTDTTIDYVACYCRGTLIRTRRGQKRVERLKIGDKVMTMSGVARPVKWIGRRSYGKRFIRGRRDILPICIKAGSLDDNVPRRDLWVSPHHAMFLDGVLIEAKALVNGGSIVQDECADTVEYFHVELETHDVIIAEGALSETFIDDNSRFMFHNGHEYQKLYPGAPAPARYCAPRLDDGYEIETARRRIARRAGLPIADSEIGGTLRGYVDLVGANRIAGWAQSTDHPDVPVCLDIYIRERLIGQVLANRYRADLRRAGIGSGRHSFEFSLPRGLIFAPHAVEVRRSRDAAKLHSSAPQRISVYRRNLRGFAS